MKCTYCDRDATEEIADDEIATFIRTCDSGECLEKAEARLEELRQQRG